MTTTNFLNIVVTRLCSADYIVFLKQHYILKMFLRYFVFSNIIATNSGIFDFWIWSLCIFLWLIKSSTPLF